MVKLFFQFAIKNIVTAIIKKRTASVYFLMNACTPRVPGNMLKVFGSNRKVRRMPLLALGVTNPFILTNPDAIRVKLHWLASAKVFMTVPERQATAVRGVIANFA